MSDLEFMRDDGGGSKCSPNGIKPASIAAEPTAEPLFHPSTSRAMW